MNKKLVIAGIFLVLCLNLVFAVECGDFVCESGEEATCPSDCTDNVIIDTGQNNIPVDDEIPLENVSRELDIQLDIGNDTGVKQKNVINTNLPEEIVAESFFSGIGFKILIIFFILIIVGVIGFVFWKMKKNNFNNQQLETPQSVN
jgi:hypothetical protein